MLVGAIVQSHFSSSRAFVCLALGCVRGAMVGPNIVNVDQPCEEIRVRLVHVNNAVRVLAFWRLALWRLAMRSGSRGAAWMHVERSGGSWSAPLGSLCSALRMCFCVQHLNVSSGRGWSKHGKSGPTM